MIADEFLNGKDNEKANMLYKNSVDPYQKEKWWPLVEYINAKMDIVGDTK